MIAAEFFPEAAWQRCIVRWYRNVFSHVPSTKVRKVVAMLKAIHAGEDLVAARACMGLAESVGDDQPDAMEAAGCELYFGSQICPVSSLSF